MPRNVIVLNNPKFTVADTEVGLTTGDPFECQVTSAMLTPQPVYKTVPSTGCAGESQSPGISGWQIDLAWLQDWGSDPSLSRYAFDNDGLRKWYSLTLDSIGLPGEIATGECWVAAGGYGGTFGDGSTAAATATWPCIAKPEIATAVAATAATEPVDESVAA